MKKKKTAIHKKTQPVNKTTVAQKSATKQVVSKQTQTKKNRKTRQLKALKLNKQAYLWMAAVCVLTLVVFIPDFNHGLTNFDDNLYITESPYLTILADGHRAGTTFSSFFTDYYMGNYHPLAMISLALDYKIGGGETWAYHTTNILIHLVSTALLFWFIFVLISHIERKQQGSKSWALPVAIITSALFGVHTIHLESVAWISERKDVLYTCFFISSMIAYVKYIDLGKRKHFIYSMVFFVLSLLSKGQAVSLAVTLIAIDFFAGRKLKDVKVMIEKAPYFIFAVIFGIVAIKAQKSTESIAVNASWSFFERILFASYGYCQYLLKLIFPANLSIFYSYPEKVSGSLPVIYYVMPLVVAAIIGLIVYSAKKNKQLAFGILFFSINIFLVLQLLPVGKALMADRYAYVPSIGFFFLVGIGYKTIISYREKLIMAANIFLVVYILGIGFYTFNRGKMWGSSLLLWENVLEQFPNEPLALNNHGDILSNQEKPDLEGALSDFNKAIEIDANYDQTYYNRGVVLAKMGDKKKALEDFNRAIELNPKHHQAYSNRGATKFELKNPQGALEDFSKAIEIRPNYAIAYTNRGSARAQLKDFQGAYEDFTKSLELVPNNAKVYHMRGLVQVDIGRKSEACDDLQRSVQLGNRAAQEAINKNCR